MTTGGEAELLVAGPADAPVLAEVHDAAFEAGWPAADIDALLRLATVQGLYLRHDGAVLGFILVGQAADEAEVLTLAVRRCRWRGGLGGRLLAAAISLSAAHGARRLVLEVGAANLAAQALYRKAGFRAVGRRAAYYKGGEDALVLELPLPAPREKEGECESLS